MKISVSRQDISAVIENSCGIGERYHAELCINTIFVYFGAKRKIFSSITLYEPGVVYG